MPVYIGGDPFHILHYYSFQFPLFNIAKQYK